MPHHRLQELVFSFKASLMHSRMPLNFVVEHVLRLPIILTPFPSAGFIGICHNLLHAVQGMNEDFH